MKINELIDRFEIFTTNEEQKLLDKLDGVSPIEYYTERERFVIENLIKKSLVSKVKHNNSYMVKKND